MPSDQDARDTKQPEWDDAPVALSLIQELVEKHPDWRTTSHHTDEGRRVMMIEFADEDGDYTTGLPGEFVALVARNEEVLGDVQ